MSKLFDAIELKHIMVPMVVTWVVCALYLLGAPILAYIGLHLATTGVFIFAAKRVMREYDSHTSDQL